MAANFNANLQYSHKKFLTFLGKCKALYTEHIAHSDPRYQLYSSGLFSPGTGHIEGAILSRPFWSPLLPNVSEKFGSCRHLRL